MPWVRGVAGPVAFVLGGGLPMDGVVEAHWWLVPSAELPRGRPLDDQVDWLFDWWGRLDTWVADRRS